MSSLAPLIFCYHSSFLLDKLRWFTFKEISLQASTYESRSLVATNGRRICFSISNIKRRLKIKIKIYICKSFNPIPIGLFLSNIDGRGVVFYPPNHSPYNFSRRVDIGECDICPRTHLQLTKYNYSSNYMSTWVHTYWNSGRTIEKFQVIKFKNRRKKNTINRISSVCSRNWTKIKL